MRNEIITRRLGPSLERRAVGNDTLWFSDACPLIDLPAIDGCIIGRLFTSDGRRPLAGLTVPEQLAIMSSGGRSLIEHASGGYVAIWRGAGNGALAVLRDPSACLPGWLVTATSNPIIASDVEILVTAGLLDLEPDPDGVAQHLAFSWVPSDRTCLVGLQELRPGFRVVLDPDPSSELLWRPSSFPRRTLTEPSSIAHAVDNVVAGQVGSAGKIAIELSGGLDSSVVAAAAGKGRDRVAIHMVPDAQDGDERRYARLVADRFQMDLLEVPVASDDIDLELRPQRLTPRPTNGAHFRITNDKLHETRLVAQASVLLSGAGGDSVFCSLASTGLVLDAWSDCGWSGAHRALTELATISGATRWNVSSHLLRRLGRSRASSRSWPDDRTLLGSVGRAAKSPDTIQLQGLRPGARAHAASILRMQTMLDNHDRIGDGDMQFPLMSQPVLEACLAIPSWRWIEGGWNRAVARTAFADRLPDAIIQRRGKARYDTLILRASERARPFLRDLLLGGWLAARDVIDAAAVERALALPVDGSEAYGRLILIADAELWCRMILDRKSVTRS